MTNKKGTGVDGSESLNGSGFCPKPTGLKKTVVGFFQRGLLKQNQCHFEPLPFSPSRTYSLSHFVSLFFTFFFVIAKDPFRTKAKSYVEFEQNHLQKEN